MGKAKVAGKLIAVGLNETQFEHIKTMYGITGLEQITKTDFLSLQAMVTESGLIKVYHFHKISTYVIVTNGWSFRVLNLYYTISITIGPHMILGDQEVCMSAKYLKEQEYTIAHAVSTCVYIDTYRKKSLKLQQTAKEYLTNVKESDVLPSKSKHVKVNNVISEIMLIKLGVNSITLGVPQSIWIISHNSNKCDELYNYLIDFFEVREKLQETKELCNNIYDIMTNVSDRIMINKGHRMEIYILSLIFIEVAFAILNAARNG